MAAEVLHRQETSRSQAFLRTDTTDYRAAFSSLALKQPRTNRLAAWMVDPDAPFCEQPPAKRIQLVLYSVHRVEAQLTKQTKPVDDIITLFARLALLNGYSAISKITSVSHGQSQGGRGSHSGRRNSGGAGQKTLGSKLTSGAGGNGSGGPSKRPMKRGGGGGDGEDRPSKRKKPSNEPQGQNVYLCIVFQLDQQSPERDEDHPCKKKKFATLEGLIDHHLRIHVGHIQCPDCLVRKGTTTDMGKHTRNANCTPPTIIRPEIVVHGESVHSVRTWDALCREVAPNGQILYDMARNIDNLPRLPPDEDTDSDEGINPDEDVNPGEDMNPDEDVNPDEDMNHVRQPVAPVPSPSIDLGGAHFPFMDLSLSQLGAYGYSEQCDCGHNLSALMSGTVDPLDLLLSGPDSGCGDLQGSSSQQSIRVSHQCGEVRNRTITGGGGGGGGVTGGNEGPEKDRKLNLLEEVTSVIKAFQDCGKGTSELRTATLCAENLALGLSKDILQEFVKVYHDKFGLKGKEAEQHRAVVDGG